MPHAPSPSLGATPALPLTALLVSLAAGLAGSSGCGDGQPKSPASAGDAASPEADGDASETASGDSGDGADAEVGGADASVTETLLVDHMSWAPYDPGEDPLASHQPASIECGVGGFYADPVYHNLDVDTAYCNYLLAAHPGLVDVAEGDTLRLRFYYFDLLATQPASAHIAVLLDDTVAWEQTIPIPSRANALDVEFAAPRALAEGAPIRLHLHNHGQNSWVLTSLMRLR